MPADLILISHGHGDHVGDAVAIARRTGAKVVSQLRDQPLAPGDAGPARRPGRGHAARRRLDFPGIGRVKLTLAFHGSALPDGSNGGNPCGFLITFDDGIKVYDAADTGLFGDMALIGEEGSTWPCCRSATSTRWAPTTPSAPCELLKPQRVLPIHYNTFPPIAQDATPGPPGSRVKPAQRPSCFSLATGSRSRASSNRAARSNALLPRQESFASLHILTRCASEGSEALPSLARRVRMSFFGARVIERKGLPTFWRTRKRG